MARLGALLATLLLTAVPAMAQYQVNPAAPGQSVPKKIEVSGFVGGLSMSQDLGSVTDIFQTVTGEANNVSFGKFLGFRASYAFTERLAAEFNFSRGNNAYSFQVNDNTAGRADLGEQFDASQSVWSGNIVFQFPLEIGLVAYGTGGFGRLKQTPTSPVAGIESISGNDFNFGGGVKYFFRNPVWLGLRFDVRFHFVSDGLAFAGNSADPNGTELTVGAVFRFF